MEIPFGFGQVNFVYTGQGLPTGAQVTCGLGVADFSGTPTDAAEVLRDHWEDQVLPLQVNSVQLTEVIVKFGPTDTGPSGTAASTQDGHITSSGIAPNVALLVSKTTSFGGRAGRGRMFIPGMTEADTLADGSVDSAYLTAAQAAFDALLTAMAADDLEARLLHSATSPLSTPTLIDAFIVQGRVATQRRRLRR